MRQADQGAGIDTSAPAYESTSRKLSNNHKNITFEAKLREISANGCCTSRHCEAGRPVATGCWHCVKFWTKHRKTLDGMTGKIISITNRTLASAYVLCHPTLLLSLLQKYRMEISNGIEDEIQETTTREEWEELS